MSKRTVEVKEPRRWHAQRAGDGEHDVESRVALAVFDAGHIAAGDPGPRRDVELADACGLAEFADSTAEPDARVLSLASDLSRHVHTLWPYQRPTTQEAP